MKQQLTLRNMLLALPLLVAVAIGANAQGTTPSISSLSLSQGPVGMGFVVTGANFGNLQGSSTIKVNTSSLTVVSWTDTSITVQVPAGAATGNVVVTVSGNSSNGVPFTIKAPFGC